MKKSTVSILHWVIQFAPIFYIVNIKKFIKITFTSFFKVLFFTNTLRSSSLMHQISFKSHVFISHCLGKFIDILFSLPCPQLAIKFYINLASWTTLFASLFATFNFHKHHWLNIQVGFYISLSFIAWASLFPRQVSLFGRPYPIDFPSHPYPIDFPSQSLAILLITLVISFYILSIFSSKFHVPSMIILFLNKSCFFPFKPYHVLLVFLFLVV